VHMFFGLAPEDWDAVIEKSNLCGKTENQVLDVDARTEDELVAFLGDGPPAPAKWASRDPVAGARLQAARVGLAELSERVGTPVENLVSPDAVRRVLWSPPEDAGLGAVAAALAERGARPWQIELTAPVLHSALDAAVVGQVTRQ